MNKLATLVLLVFSLSLVSVGCAGNKTKDDEAPTEASAATEGEGEATEAPAREIQPATSGGMERMDEEGAEESGEADPE